MRIEQIHVDGFGRFSGKDLVPSEHLTLYRGRNEAGKSTLLNFVRAILFGFDGRYPAVKGGRRGGRLMVRMADGHGYSIERYGDKRGMGTLKVTAEDGTDSTGALAGLLQGVDATQFNYVFAFGLSELAAFDKLSGAEVMGKLTGAVQGTGPVNPLDVEKRFATEAAGLFLPSAQIPAINKTLARLEAIDAELKKRNLPEEFGARSEELKAAEAERQELVRAVALLDADVARAGRHATCWESWQDLLDAEAHRVQMGSVALLPANIATELGTAIRGRDDAAKHATDQRTAQDDAAAALTAIAVDDAVLARRPELEALATEAIKDGERADQLAGLGRQFAGAQSGWDGALQRLGPAWDAERVRRFDDSLPVGAELNGRLRDLLGRTGDIVRTARGDHAEAGRAKEAAEAEHAAVVAQAAALAEPEDAAPVEELERRLRGLDNATAGKGPAAAALERAKRAAQDARAVLPAAPAGRRWDEVAADAAALGQAIRDETSSRDAMAYLTPILGAGAAGSAAPRTLVGIPVWLPALVGVAAAAVFGVVGQPISAVIALVAGVALTAGIWQLGKAAGASGAGASAGGGAAEAFARAERAAQDAAARRTTLAAQVGAAATVSGPDVELIASRAAASARAEGDAVSLEMAVTRAQADLVIASDAVAAAATLAGISVPPTDADIDRYRAVVTDARRRAEQRGLLKGRLEESSATMTRRAAEFARMAQALDEAEAAATAAKAEWTTWLERHDLVGMPDRDTAQQVIAAVTVAKAALAKLADIMATMKGLQTAHAEYAAKATALGVDLGLPSAVAGPAEGEALALLASALRDALRTAVDAATKRTAATEALAVAGRASGLATRDLSEAQAALDALLAAYGQADPEALRVALEQSVKAKDLDDRIAAATAILVAQSGVGEALAKLREELQAIDGREDIDAAIASSAAELDEARRQLNELSERIGGLRKFVDEMLKDASVSVERQRREDLLGNLDEKARDWAAVSVAKHLMHTSRVSYETAHRPAVISTAERYFNTWTDGRFTRILAPLGGSIEAVQRPDGETVALDALSTGTAQQLYLAIRFGLLEHFAQSAEPLPVVMDDILVNFDAERAALTAASIKALAKTHQVLYFTCHDEVPITADVEETLPRL